MLRSIKSNQLKERRLSFKVTGTGTATINVGSGLADLTDNGTGDYTLTFDRPFQRVGCALGTTVTDVTTMRVKTLTTTAVNVECVGADQTTATDAVFFLEVTGWDSVDEADENL